MRIGLVGYQGSGKSTLFEWLTGVASDPAKAHETQSTMAPLNDPWVEPLCQIYQPKKVTLASLEIADTPGLNRKHEGNPARLGLIREAGCLVLVVPGFAAGDDDEVLADLGSFQEDLQLTDMEILSGRIERLRESVKKPRPNRDQEMAELAALEPLLSTLESGTVLADVEMTEEQHRATRSFQLLTEKPRLVVVNLADDDANPERFAQHATPAQPIVALRLGIELELARMSPEDRQEFEQDLGLKATSPNALLAQLLDVSGQMLYYTAGEKEVRTWMLRKGGTALEAADNVHSDLARGFIRAEVMQCEDLVQLGSEREVKAQQKMRSEHKEYVVQRGDILHIRHNV